MFSTLLLYSKHIILKHLMIFECSCVDGFKGDFCESKTEQDHLLFFSRRNIQYVFNADGELIEERSVGEQTDSLSVTLPKSSPPSLHNSSWFFRTKGLDFARLTRDMIMSKH